MSVLETAELRVVRGHRGGGRRQCADPGATSRFAALLAAHYLMEAS